METGFRRPLAESAWELYYDEEGAKAAARFAARLAAAERPDRSPPVTCCWRAARCCGATRGSELHYWKAQPPERLDPELAAELLAAIESQGDDAALAVAAQRLCDESQGHAKDPRCAASLLARIRRHDLAATVLPEATGDETPDELIKLISMAHSTGRSELPSERRAGCSRSTR